MANDSSSKNNRNGACVSFLALVLSLALPASLFQGQDLPSKTNSPASRMDAWRILGPGGGGAQFYPAVSPHDPNLVLVACDMTGAYISRDGGNSWRLFNLRVPVKFFVFDPLDSQVIYAGASSLWRSTDTGGTWNLVFPAPDAVTRLIFPDDHASPEVETKDGAAAPVTALAVDPKNSNVLYMGLGRPGNAAFVVSKDGGVTWSRDPNLPQGMASGIEKIYVDPHSPQTDRTLYVVGTNSVAIRKAGQWEQEPSPAGVTEFRDVSAGFSQDGRLMIYAVAGARRRGSPSAGGIFVSDNGGAKWENVSAALLRNAAPGAPVPDLEAVGASFGHPEVAYLSFEDMRAGPAAKQMVHGAAKTTDGGRTWSLVWNESDTAAPNVHDAWITERFGTGWGEPGLSLGVAPNDPNICYRTDLGRTMRTTDGGRTWEAVYSERMPDHTYTSTGLDVTTNYGVFFDPFDAKRMFIAYTDIGLFRSENSGRSWTSATIGVPRRWQNTTYWITFDPDVKGRAWGVMSNTHDLPRPKMWRRTSPSKFDGGVCISDDGGKTWRASSTGMPPTAATHILLDPESPRNARVLYVTGLGQGVFKSPNGGKTWSLKNKGLPGPEPFAWRLARDQQGTLYLVVARRSEDGSFGNAGDGALYRSTDGAEHWTRIQLPEGVNGPNGIQIDSGHPDRLYLAAWGRHTTQGAAQGGVYVSSDGGKTWKNTLDRDQHIYDITIDPRDPNIVYACGFESSAWRSTDRGETWQRIQGYNFKWGHRVIPDPQDPAMIYVTTFGGSVWHGPAAGDPGAVEDIVTPALEYKK
ncbi:MAG TPA: hypothetical protein VKV95_21650 [Terriglobia bacterium]|nr:hypothetical protein [Terriglobia bacterium]